MSEHDEDRLGEMQATDMRRIQMAALLCIAATTGQRLARLLQHNATFSTAYYARIVDSKVLFAFRKPDREASESAIARETKERLRRMSLWTEEFDRPSPHESQLTRGVSHGVGQQQRRDESASSLFRERADLDRVTALQAHLAALDAQLSPSS